MIPLGVLLAVAGIVFTIIQITEFIDSDSYIVPSLLILTSIIGIAGGLFLIQYDINYERTIETTKSISTYIELPDGTKIYLQSPKLIQRDSEVLPWYILSGTTVSYMIYELDVIKQEQEVKQNPPNMEMDDE